MHHSSRSWWRRVLEEFQFRGACCSQGTLYSQGEISHSLVEAVHCPSMISLQTQCLVEFSTNFLNYFGHILQDILQVTCLLAVCLQTHELYQKLPKDLSSCSSLVTDVSSALILFFCSWSFIFLSGCLVNSPQKNTDAHFSI